MDFPNLIQQVIHKRATQEELKVFNELLEKDPDFQQLYQEALDIRVVAMEDKKSSLRHIFKEHENTVTSSKDPIPNSSKKGGVLKYLIPLVAAAAIIIFILNMSVNSITATDLYEQNYEPYRNVMGGIERGEVMELDMVSRAFYEYEIKNYVTASQLFAQLYETDQQSMYLFYHANSQLGLGNSQAAISLYKQHQDVQDDFYARSRWFLSLAYLKNGQLPDCKNILEEISKVESYNYFKARELLERLEDL